MQNPVICVRFKRNLIIRKAMFFAIGNRFLILIHAGFAARVELPSLEADVN
jgi:hypothetical protein